MEYKTISKTQIFSGRETNSIYSVGVKCLFIVKARSEWVAQVMEEICTRTGKRHEKASFLLSILTIALLFFFPETFRYCLHYFCKVPTVDYFDLVSPRSVVGITTSGMKNV